MIGSDNIAHVEINKRVFSSRRILILFVLLLFCYLFYNSGQAVAETSYYYLDISLYSEGYADFEITVNDYGDFGGILMELPTPNCENNKTNFSIIKNNVRVSEIPDIQTLIGKIDLENMDSTALKRGWRH